MGIFDIEGKEMNGDVKVVDLLDVWGELVKRGHSNESATVIVERWKKKENDQRRNRDAIPVQPPNAGPKESRFMNNDLKSRAKKILEIDLDRLEEEWEKQPLLCFEFMTDLVEAREEMDRRMADLKLTDAELDHEVRSHPERFDLEKTTEAAVEAAILRDARHKGAHERWLAAKSSVGILQAAVECVTDQRKKALENEVDLLLGGYWSKPRSAPASPGRANDHAKKKATRPTIRRHLSAEDAGDSFSKE